MPTQQTGPSEAGGETGRPESTVSSERPLVELVDEIISIARQLLQGAGQDGAQVTRNRVVKVVR